MGTFCDGPTCEVDRDLHKCCDAAMPCTNLTCPWNHVHTPDRYCPTTVCIYSRDVDHCCELGVPIRFVRFSPVQLRALTADDLFKPVAQLAEFTPYFHNTRTSLETASAYAPDGDFPPLESPAQAIDNDPGTKWLDFQSSAFTVEYADREKMDTFTLTTANDLDSRDPVGWRLEGSMDGTTYVLIHETSDAFTEVPTARLTETQHFPIYVPCLPPRSDIIVNGLPEPCLEGNLIASDTSCTPVCAPGYQPSVTLLNCSDGVLQPPTFRCL